MLNANETLHTLTLPRSECGTARRHLMSDGSSSCSLDTRSLKVSLSISFNPAMDCLSLSALGFKPKAANACFSSCSSKVPEPSRSHRSKTKSGSCKHSSSSDLAGGWHEVSPATRRRPCSRVGPASGVFASSWLWQQPMPAIAAGWAGLCHELTTKCCRGQSTYCTKEPVFAVFQPSPHSLTSHWPEVRAFGRRPRPCLDCLSIVHVCNCTAVTLPKHAAHQQAHQLRLALCLQLYPSRAILCSSF